MKVEMQELPELCNALNSEWDLDLVMTTAGPSSHIGRVTFSYIQSI
jgi:hypothetical protein